MDNSIQTQTIMSLTTYRLLVPENSSNNINLISLVSIVIRSTGQFIIFSSKKKQKQPVVAINIFNL
jgi:hypothetical protein